jgi:hypothetical protein
LICDLEKERFGVVEEQACVIFQICYRFLDIKNEVSASEVSV